MPISTVSTAVRFSLISPNRQCGHGRGRRWRRSRFYTLTPTRMRERKAQTALALDGVSERSLDCFLLLWRHFADLRREEMELATISDATVESHSTLNAAGWSDDAWVAAVDDLIARGLLGANPSVAARIGGAERWSRHFRFTSDSEWFERLLERARACLNTQTILSG